MTDEAKALPLPTPKTGVVGPTSIDDSGGTALDKFPSVYPYARATVRGVGGRPRPLFTTRGSDPRKTVMTAYRNRKGLSVVRPESQVGGDRDVRTLTPWEVPWSFFSPRSLLFLKVDNLRTSDDRHTGTRSVTGDTRGQRDVLHFAHLVR